MTASPAQIKAATRQFLYLRPAKGPLNKERKRSKTARKGGSGSAKANLVDFTVTSRGQGQLAKDARRLPRLLPAQAREGLLLRGGRAAHLHDHRRPTTGATAPTRWSSSPATSASTTACRARPGATRRSSQHASEKRTIQGREYLLFYNGDRLRLVGWKTDRGSYWISNTLLQTLSAKEMLGVARSLVRAR